MKKKFTDRLAPKKEKSPGTRRANLHGRVMISKKELNKRFYKNMGNVHGSRGLEFQYPMETRTDAVGNKVAP